jgi:hypothetical protein
MQGSIRLVDHSSYSPVQDGRSAHPDLLLIYPLHVQQ